MATTMVSPVMGGIIRGVTVGDAIIAVGAPVSAVSDQIGTVQLSFHVGTVSPVVGLICGGDAGKLFEGVPG